MSFFSKLLRMIRGKKPAPPADVLYFKTNEGALDFFSLTFGSSLDYYLTEQMPLPAIIREVQQSSAKTTTCIVEIAGNADKRLLAQTLNPATGLMAGDLVYWLPIEYTEAKGPLEYIGFIVAQAAPEFIIKKNIFRVIRSFTKSE